MEIAETFSRQYKKAILRRSINDIKREKAEILKNIEEKNIVRYRLPKLKYEEIDARLSEWFEKIELKGDILNGRIIQEKANMIANELRSQDFKGSVGCLTEN